ncbi:MAG TPA: DUF1015 domain-containing protein [Bacteroidota bacterium]|nr:DUF1015 domain-containing protein [Bacteroidota bacterium]
MPAVKPFAALRYDPAKVDPGRVMAPPYDVIDDRLREALYGRDPRNIVRLILGKGDDPYADAARDLADWTREGTLVRDPAPSVYLLEQEWVLPDGQTRRRTGFIAACRLEDRGGPILPHEKTHAGPKEDRLRLMKSTGMMFSQIFSLYADPGGILGPALAAARSGRPAMDLLHEGIVSRLWVCTDDLVALAVTEFLRGKTVLIADGHHRYETALAFRDAMRLNNPSHHGHEPYNFVPMFFSNLSDPGLMLLPTHRLLRGLPGFKAEVFLSGLREFFSMTPYATAEALLARLESGPERELGLGFPGRGGFHLLRPKPAAARLLDHLPTVVSRMDVTLLHTVVFGRILGLSQESQEKKINLDYERDVPEILRMLGRAETYQAAFFMKAPPVEQVKTAAEAGHTLPQKTTYFYPKLLSGLVNYACTGEPGP